MLLLLLKSKDLVWNLVHLHRALESKLRNDVFASVGLSLEQGWTLWLLGNAAPDQASGRERGFLTFGELADAMFLTKPAISRRLGELKSLGLVETRPVSDRKLQMKGGVHGSEHAARLTALGKKRIAPVVKALEQLSRELAAGLGPEHRQALAALRQRVEHRLRKMKT